MMDNQGRERQTLARRKRYLFLRTGSSRLLTPSTRYRALTMAGAVAFGYSAIFVTAPSPENLQTVFAFCVRGLKALKYMVGDRRCIIRRRSTRTTR